MIPQAVHQAIAVAIPPVATVGRLVARAEFLVSMVTGGGLLAIGAYSFRVPPVEGYTQSQHTKLGVAGVSVGTFLMTTSTVNLVLSLRSPEYAIGQMAFWFYQFYGRKIVDGIVEGYFAELKDVPLRGK